MPLADIPAETAFVGAESVAVARQPVGLIVEHVVALRAVGHASAVLDDVTFSPQPTPTANKARHPTTWAFLFFSEFLMIRHIIPPVMFSPAHREQNKAVEPRSVSLGVCSEDSFIIRFLGFSLAHLGRSAKNFLGSSLLNV